jgi:hypothetical protein
MTSAINDAIPVAGTLIDATAIRGNFVTAKSEVSALQTAKLAADGSVNPSANQPMAGFKHTGVAAASAAGQYIEYAQAYAMASLGKNALLNGNFNINQRAVSGTVTLAAGVYGYDRWKAGASGCTYTYALSGGINTLTISAGTLLQIIEGNNLPLGTNTCVLSWTGTAQGRYGAGSYGATGLTASVVGGTNLTIEFSTGTLSLVQLEKGSIATPYEQRPYPLELGLCQYYYEQIISISYQAVGSGTINSAGTASILLTYNAKRAVPVIAISAGWTIDDGVVNTAATLSAQNSGLNSSFLLITAPSLTTGRGALLLADTTVGRTLSINAEL